MSGPLADAAEISRQCQALAESQVVELRGISTTKVTPKSARNKAIWPLGERHCVTPCVTQIPVSEACRSAPIQSGENLSQHGLVA